MILQYDLPLRGKPVLIHTNLLVYNCFKNCPEHLNTNGLGLDRAPVEFQRLVFFRPPTGTVTVKCKPVGGDSPANNPNGLCRVSGQPKVCCKKSPFDSLIMNSWFFSGINSWSRRIDKHLKTPSPHHFVLHPITGKCCDYCQTYIEFQPKMMCSAQGYVKSLIALRPQR